MNIILTQRSELINLTVKRCFLVCCHVNRNVLISHLTHTAQTIWNMKLFIVFLPGVVLSLLLFRISFLLFFLQNFVLFSSNYLTHENELAVFFISHDYLCAFFRSFEGLIYLPSANLIKPTECYSIDAWAIHKIFVNDNDRHYCTQKHY